MAALTAGRAKSCAGGECSGGVDRIYIANKADILTVTVTSDAVTAITMAASKVFYRFDSEDDMAMFKETLKVTGCSTVVDQELNLGYFCRNDVDRKTIMELAGASCCGLVVIHKESTGNTWIWGLDTADVSSTRIKGKLDTVTSDTGKLFEDQNKSELVVKAKSKYLAQKFTPGVAGVPL